MLGGLSPSSPIISTGDERLDEELVILFDEAHGQWFNTSRMQTVVDMVNGSAKTSMFVNTSPFNATNLMGVDVVIITNPGNDTLFTSDEAFYLNQYVNRGGGLFLLSNPYNTNETLSGRSERLNALLSSMNALDFADLKFWFDANQDADTILDDHNSINDSSGYISLSVDKFTNSTNISSFPTNISQILIHSQSISAPIRISEAYISSYAEDAAHVVHLADEIPLWLGGYNKSDSRIVISGSTIMFSDLIIPGTNIAWISHPNFDNLNLFNNTVNWIANVIHEEIVIDEPVDSPLPIFVIGGVLLLGVGVIFLIRPTPEKEERPITEAIQDIRTKGKTRQKRSKRRR